MGLCKLRKTWLGDFFKKRCLFLYYKSNICSPRRGKENAACVDRSSGLRGQSSRDSPAALRAQRPAPLSQAPGPPSTALPAVTTTGRQVVLRRRVPELRDTEELPRAGTRDPGLRLGLRRHVTRPGSREPRQLRGMAGAPSWGEDRWAAPKREPEPELERWVFSLTGRGCRRVTVSGGTHVVFLGGAADARGQALTDLGCGSESPRLPILSGDKIRAPLPGWGEHCLAALSPLTSPCRLTGGETEVSSWEGSARRRARASSTLPKGAPSPRAGHAPSVRALLGGLAMVGLRVIELQNWDPLPPAGAAPF